MKYKYKGSLSLIMIAAFIICAAAGMVSCAPAPTPTPTPTPTPAPEPEPAPEEESLIGFYPLKEGNMWEYEGEGMEYASFIQKVIFSSGNRHQVTIDNGGTIIANVLEESEGSIVNIYRSGEEFSGGNLLDKPSNVNIIMLQTPLEKGNFWISEENHYEIINTEADVVVPAGEFKGCIAVKVTFKDQTSNMTYYYKRGIGMVQSEFRTDSGDLITSKLKRYELK
ncbi:MAG TPA: hypothetical protein PKU88_08845 [Bacillota bacterium]|nr:hypothetical protein [Bacillota bacterium]HNT02190.1 hypothetical protein [Bacillota bacterium]HPA54312.1 hypothetical protein [Bacillota bacterium]HPX69419.1 hypothetical protein [Bacillota bacterium]HQA64764.1 hypothetical protein [Bacillota bacterium]